MQRLLNQVPINNIISRKATSSGLHSGHVRGDGDGGDLIAKGEAVRVAPCAQRNKAPCSIQQLGAFHAGKEYARVIVSARLEPHRRHPLRYTSACIIQSDHFSFVSRMRCIELIDEWAVGLSITVT